MLLCKNNTVKYKILKFNNKYNNYFLYVTKLKWLFAYFETNEWLVTLNYIKV